MKKGVAVVVALLFVFQSAAIVFAVDEQGTNITEQNQIQLERNVLWGTQPGIGGLDDAFARSISTQESSRVVPESTYDERYYYSQLSPVARALYDAILASDLAKGPTKTVVKADVSNLDIGLRTMKSHLVHVKTGPDAGYFYIADDNAIQSVYRQAISALVYDRPELSWLVNVEWHFKIPVLNENRPPAFFAEMAIGESRDYLEEVVLTELAYNLTDTGYAQATTSCDAISSAEKYNYADTKDYATIQAAIVSATEELGNLASYSPYEKIKKIHDWVCAHLQYADIRSAKYINGWRGYQTVYSALIEGTTVCSGYAKAFKLLCDAYNIPCVLVHGMGNDELHLWNYVMLDGLWYGVDCTWDDTDNTDAWFLKGVHSFGAHTEMSFCEDYTFAYPALAELDYIETSKVDNVLDGNPLLYQTDHFAVYATQYDANMMHDLGAALEEQYARTLDMLHLNAPKKVQIVLFHDADTFESERSQIEEGTTLSSYGAISTSLNRIWMTSPRNSGYLSYTAALQEAKRYLVYLLGDLYTRPAYLAEGVARYICGMNDWVAYEIQNDQQMGTVPSLEEIQNLHQYDHRLTTYSYALVAFLIDTYGMDSVVALLDGKDFGGVVGISGDALNQKWQEYLQKTYPEDALFTEQFVVSDSSNMIAGVQMPTTVRELKLQYPVPTSASAMILNAGKLCEDTDLVGTGYKFLLRGPFGETIQMPILVEGDVLGTGTLNIAQLVKMAAAVSSSEALSGIFARAADLNGNGKVDISDVAQEAQRLIA